MTREVTKWSDIPAWEAVYAMYDRTPSSAAAYVGESANLRARLVQHFVRRDSSVVTGASAAGLNIDLVRVVQWWEHDCFDDKTRRVAAELVAFDVLDPTLRSRANASDGAWKIYDDDEQFTARMRDLFATPPTGRLTLPSLADVAQDVADLADRVEALESLVRKLLES